MLIERLLRHDRIRLEMRTRPLAADEVAELGPRAGRVLKERILGEIAEFLDATSPVGNAVRLEKDLIHRERKANTAIGGGVAIPHVRTPTVKEPVLAILRSTEGLDFEAPDGASVHIFLVLVAPPWDDKLYLKVYREVGETFQRADAVARLLEARSENDVFAFFRTPHA